MNASQEPAHPQQPGPPPPDPSGGAPAWSGDQAWAGGVTGPGGGYGLAHPSGPGDVDGYPLGVVAERTARRPWRRTLVVSVSMCLLILALGAPLGLLWAWLAPSVPVVGIGHGDITFNDPSPEEYIAADGWFTLLGLGFGLLVAIAAWMVLRRDRGPYLLLGVVAGALGAGYLVAPRIGEMIGRGDYQHWRDTAQQGATYLAPPEVHSLGPLLVPAFAAAIALTLMAGWSNDPDLDAPGARPGYGPNTDEPALDGPEPGYGPGSGYGLGSGFSTGSGHGPGSSHGPGSG